ncbi:MAG: hypothetical protein WB822_20940, partial [Rhodoplanes sp.]
TDHHRTQSMMEALRKLHVPNSIGAPLFFFTTRDELRAADPLTHEWRRHGSRRTVAVQQTTRWATSGHPASLSSTNSVKGVDGTVATRDGN